MKKLLPLLLASLCALGLASAVHGGTPTVQEQRYIPKASTAPVIDGFMSRGEWDNALAVPVNEDNTAEMYGSSTATVCPDSMFYWMWDDNGLYLFADINDTTTPDTVLTPNSGHYNLGDGIQAIMFPDLTAIGAAQNRQYVWSMVVASGGKAEVGEHYVYGTSYQIGRDVEAVIADCSTNGSAYKLEVFFPSEVFTPSEKPILIREGTTFAMINVVMEMMGSAQSLYADSAWFNAPYCNKYTLVSTPMDEETGDAGTDIPDEPEIVFTLQDTEGRPGGICEIELTADSIAQVNSVSLYEMTYDPEKLSFLGFSDTEETEDKCKSSIGFDSKVGVISFELSRAEVLSGSLGKLRFRLSEDFTSGSAEIGMTSSAANNSHEVCSEVQKGTVTAKNRLLGDMSDNDSVDIDDAIMLFRHSMLPELYPLSYPGTLDFAEDGNVDILDARHLFNYSMLPSVYPIMWGDEAEETPISKPYPVSRLTIGGKNISNFVISYNSSAGGVLAKAAKELQSYIRQATGVTLPIRTYKVNSGNRILIDETLVTDTDSTFRIKNDSYGLVIGGNAKRGALYAVYHFLEEFLGWRFFASDTEVCLDSDAIDISGVNYTFEHSFLLRDIYDLDYFDKGISVKRYQNGDGKRRNMEDVGGVMSYCPNGIHTFWILNNEESEGDQPCLNDTTVRATMRKNIRAFLDRNPDSWAVHVSQNDNIRYCTCSECMADINYYGSPAGSIIELCNWIAEDLETYNGGKYKDVYVMTFAYQYSLDCPSNIVCHPQVMVQFAIIDICHQHALTDPECTHGNSEALLSGTIKVRGNAEVIEEIEKWCKICDHFYLWDYAMNFRYYYSPMPNFDVLLENYRYLIKLGCRGFIYQSNVQAPSAEFGVLRSYLIAKITENPDMTEAEYQNHINEFLMAYYGSAWTYIREYFDFVQNLCDEHGECFGIYNSPEMMFGYHAFAPYSLWLTELFGKALNAQGLTDAQLLHVKYLRTSAEYLRLGAIHKAEMDSGDYSRQNAQKEAVKAFYLSLFDLGQTWVDESTLLPDAINYNNNVRTWINNTTRHHYVE
ncbi:MAG: DUF4838 domain-containing protein [Ruminococcaceae bacterium]|nr:DUF4838 domain-containing protein [Oscillospiraceae bacterium]